MASLFFIFRILRWSYRTLSNMIEYLYHKSYLKNQTRHIHSVLANGLAHMSIVELFAQVFPVFPSGMKWSESARLQQQNIKQTRMLYREADNAIKHIVNYLGSGEVSIDMHGREGIDWHTDQKSGVTWPKDVFYLFTRTVRVDGSDIKWVRELSRAEHLIRLGQAYQLATVDGEKHDYAEKYAQEVIDQINQWIIENPWPWGSNWQCTMDVGLRVVNWLIALDLIRESRAFKLCICKQEIIYSIYIHGRHIYKNPEKYFGGITNNHFLSDLVSQIFVGMSLPFVKESSKWVKHGLSELEKEVSKQFLPESGLSFEASTGYNRLEIELLLLVKLIHEAKRERCPTWLYSAIENAVGATDSLLKSNGKVPAFGDQDNGRALSMYPHHNLYHAYLSDEIYHSDKDYLSPEMIWTRGYYRSQNIEKKKLKHFSFADVGWHGWRVAGWDVTMICGSIGTRGDGGHSHNDQLSFDLSVDGIDICGDPGTYCYTSDPITRDIYRSTNMHSTVYLEGLEQHEMPGSFKRSGPGKGAIKKWEQVKDHKFLFEGEFSGPYKHKRTMILNVIDNSLSGVDLVTNAEGKTNIFWTLILTPNVKYLQVSDNKVELRSGNLLLHVEIINNELSKCGNNTFTYSEIPFSEAYGEKLKSNRLHYRMENNATLSWKISKVMTS